MTAPREQGQGSAHSWRAEVRPLQWDWRETNDIEGGLTSKRRVEASPLQKK